MILKWVFQTIRCTERCVKTIILLKQSRDGIVNTLKTVPIVIKIVGTAGL